MTLDELDFAAMYREHMVRVGRPKPPGVWDARADQIGQHQQVSPYVEAFVSKVDLRHCHSLLDVGCGTGLITLRLAPSLTQVYGLDYSPRMLHWLSTGAERLGLPQVQPILRSWDDDWQDIPRCDVVIASRSTAVPDMAAALEKLHDKALKHVYLTSLVGGEFALARAQRIIGRDVPPPLPDHRYVIHILAQMGIHPCVDYIVGMSQEGLLPTQASAIAQLEQRLGLLSPKDVRCLEDWAASAGGSQAWSTLFRDRWAVISWNKTE